MGACRVAAWPDEALLSLWDIPPTDPAVLLHRMIGTGGPAAHHADILYAVLNLAINAPVRLPVSPRLSAENDLRHLVPHQVTFALSALARTTAASAPDGPILPRVRG